ncbi:MAG: replicative DNA helicase [Candidatus Methylomirabilales bacterium]
MSEDRIPPSAIPSEQAMLGACLQLPEAATYTLEAVRESDCYKQVHARILAAIRAVVSKGDQPDLLTVARHLEATRRLQEVGGAAYLAELVDVHCPAPSNFKAYVKPILDTAARRRVIEACTRAMQAAYDESGSLPEAVRSLEEDVEIATGEDPQGPGKSATVVKLADALNVWRQAWEDGRQPARVRTPSEKLNKSLAGGFEPGDLIYLGARPGVGKTAFALETARTAAEQGMGVLVISREMAIERLVRRILAQTTRIPATIIRNGLFEDTQYASLVHAYGKLAALPLWLCDTAVSLEQITRLVERWSFTPGLGLVIVDYLQLVRAPAGIRDRRIQVETVSQGLKGLAMSAHLPVLCLSSLSRPEKDKQDRKPGLSDLRDSGELEHDADIVLFLHRGFNEEETLLIVAKNRDGRVGETKLRFRSEYVAFEQAEEGV